MQRFSSLGIIAGGDPVANSAILRPLLLPGAAILADDSAISYNFSTVAGALECGFNGLSILAETPRVAFSHVGSGRFFSFDGQTTLPSADAVKQITFGGAYPIRMRGNSATTDLCFARKLADCDFKVRPRDAAISLFRVSGVGALASVGAVECRFDITSSPDWDNEAFTVQSQNGFLGHGMYNNQLRLNVESAGLAPSAGYAQYFDESRRNELRAGSSGESDGAGALWLTSTCHGFNVSATDNEVNGTGLDLVCRGTMNSFRTFAATNAEVDGDRNTFWNCDLPGLKVKNAFNGSRNGFYHSDLTGWIDSGNVTVVRSCIGASDKN